MCYEAFKFQTMNEVYHIKIKKEYAAALIDDLIKVNAVEDIEASNTELDKELNANADNSDYANDTEKKAKANNAGKYEGILTKEEGDKFNNHLKQARNEWDSNF